MECRAADVRRRNARGGGDRDGVVAMLLPKGFDDLVEREALAGASAAREEDIFARHRQADGALLLGVELRLDGGGGGGASAMELRLRGGGSGASGVGRRLANVVHQAFELLELRLRLHRTALLCWREWRWRERTVS